MTDKDRIDDTALEALFDDARATAPQVSDALMARIIADAQAVRPVQAKARGLRGLIASLGGLPALGGLVTATCVGFWLGVAPPAAVPDLAATVLGVDVAAETEMDGYGLSAYGWDLDEG